jgi:hypothetical protein
MTHTGRVRRTNDSGGRGPTVWLNPGMKRTLATLTIAVAALGLAACSSSDAESSAACAETKPIDNVDVASAVAAAQLPAGVTVVGGRVNDVDGGIGVAVDICAPDVTTADDLRPIATDLAKAIKASPVGADVTTMWVESYQVDGSEAVNDVKVKDPDFKMHLYNGMPSAQAEQGNWEVLAG